MTQDSKKYAYASDTTTEMIESTKIEARRILQLWRQETTKVPMKRGNQLKQNPPANCITTIEAAPTDDNAQYLRVSC